VTLKQQWEQLDEVGRLRGYPPQFREGAKAAFYAGARIILEDFMEFVEANRPTDEVARILAGYYAECMEYMDARIREVRR
jgi:hypothetical protein